MAELEARLAEKIRTVPDFPAPGILFRDLTPVFADVGLFGALVEALTIPYMNSAITHVVGIESRGFILATPIALRLGAAFVPARKPGKLPATCEREPYSLEYGADALEMHTDAFLAVGAENAAADSDGVKSDTEHAAGTIAGGGRHSKPRVLIVDDVIATGGTAAATCRLVERLGGDVISLAVAVELTSLGARERALTGREILSVVKYPREDSNLRPTV